MYFPAKSSLVASGWAGAPTTERPLACVVFKPGRSATPEELREFLAGKFARWQLPDAFEFIDAIPRTSTGKFWKVKLRDRYAQWAWPEGSQTPAG